jgi:hypothetical protein
MVDRHAPIVPDRTKGPPDRTSPVLYCGHRVGDPFAAQQDQVVTIGAIDEATDGRQPPHPSRPTLEVVAALAQVSRATASRVLRGDPRVREETREAVLRAAGEVSYTVNRAARSLVTNRTDSVAFLVAENEDRFFSDPYFLGILRGAQAETARVGLQLVFVVASTSDELAHFEHYARAGHVDGVLLISLHGDDLLPQHLESMRPLSSTADRCRATTRSTTSTRTTSEADAPRPVS